MPMDACKQCFHTRAAMPNMALHCDQLSVYSQLCLVMPDMSECASWSDLCKIIPDWPICPKGAGNTVCIMYYSLLLSRSLLFSRSLSLSLSLSSSLFLSSLIYLFIIIMVARGVDVISMLVAIYGSPDVFVEQYQTLLSTRLLKQTQFFIDKEVIAIYIYI